MDLLAILFGIACIPVIYILTMALFGAYIEYRKALWVAVPVMIGIVVFAMATA